MMGGGVIGFEQSKKVVEYNRRFYDFDNECGL